MNLLHHLDPRSRQALLALGRRQELTAGEVLVRRGAMSGDIFLVEEGCLEVVDPRGRPAVVLGLIGPGEVVGELGFVDAAPRSADVRARQATICLAWRRAELRRLLEQDPAVGRSFWAAIAEVAVQRVRSLSDTIRAGAPARRAEVDPDDEEVDELAAGLAEAWARAEQPAEGEAPAPELLAEALIQLGARLGRVGDLDRADALGAALDVASGELLRRSHTAALLLGRPAARPPGEALLTHLRGGSPVGERACDRALDRALLDLPTLAGLRQAATSLALPSPAPIYSIAPASLGRPDLAPCLDPVLLAQAGPGLPPGALQPGSQASIAIDLLAETLPDRLLVTLLTGLRGALSPGGAIRLALVGPAPDDPLLDHLLRWPMLRRTPETLAELATAAGLRVERLLQAGPVAVLELRAVQVLELRSGQVQELRSGQVLELRSGPGAG